MRRRVMAAGSVVAVCAAALFSLGMGAKPPTVNLDTFGEEVAQSLPQGASIDQVVKFLDAHRLPHTGLKSPEQEIVSVVRVMRFSKPGSAVARAELQFWFTQDGKLAKYAVREYDASLN